MKSKDLIYRIAEKLDQSEKGYVVPKITYLDNKESIILEYPKGLYMEKFIVTVSKIPKILHEKDNMKWIRLTL